MLAKELAGQKVKYPEAEITINGEQITYGESMTIRVACSDFLARLQDKEEREGLGEQLAEAYEINLRAILTRLVSHHQS